MADPLSWTDPTAIIGGTGLLAGVGAVVKTVLDWRKDRGSQRATSEDMVRDDLLATMRDQRDETAKMRTELASARTEIRAQDEWARMAIRACEDRAEKFLDELRKLHSENDALRGRYHRLVNYVSQVTATVDLDRVERGLLPLPIPSWVDEHIPGPTARPSQEPPA